MPADISQKFNVIDFGQPVGVVQQKSPAVGKIKILGKLSAQTLRVVIDLLPGEHLTHFRFAAGVADQSCAAANQRDGFVAAFLHMRQRHDGDKRADMQTRCRGIETGVTGDRSFREEFLNQRFIGNLFNKTSFLENVICAFHPNIPL